MFWFLVLATVFAFGLFAFRASSFASLNLPKDKAIPEPAPSKPEITVYTAEKTKAKKTVAKKVDQSARSKKKYGGKVKSPKTKKP